MGQKNLRSLVFLSTSALLLLAGFFMASDNANAVTGSNVHYYKYIDGALATTGSFAVTGSYQYGENSPTVTPINLNLNSGDSYTDGVIVPTNTNGFTGTETTGGDSNVVASQDDCSPGEYYLAGYTYSDVSLEDAASKTLQSDASLSDFTDFSGDRYVIVWNNSCPVATTGTITIHKDVVAPDGETGVTDDHTFTAHLNGGDGQTFSESSPTTFTDLAPGNYTITEDADPNYDFVSFTGTDSDGVATVIAGQDTSVTITNEQHPATLTIVKNTDPNSGDGTFSFSIDGTDGTTSPDAPADLSTNADNNYSASEDVSLTPGSYDVKEIFEEESPWHLVDVSCVYEGGDEGTSITNGEHVSVDSGDRVTCTFTDTTRAAIIVNKTVINAYGGTATAGDFSFSINNADETVATQSFNTFEDASHGKNIVFVNNNSGYSVSENENEKYTTAYGKGCDDIDLSDTNVETCDITNYDKPALLTIVKNSDGQGGEFGFNINGTGGTEYSGSLSLSTNEENNFITISDPISLNSGSYNITENGAEGWTLADVTCFYDNGSVGESLPEGGEAITVDNGDDVTCNFINTKRAIVKVKKIVINNDGGTATASNFSFSVNGSEPIPFTADSENPLDGTGYYIGDAGTFNVTETAESGYTTTYDNCSDLEATPGTIQTCTITNDDIAQSGGGGGNTYTPPSSTPPPSNPTPPPVAPPPPTTNGGSGIQGDFNGDGSVDYYDFSIMMANWLKTGPNVCDLNGDGIVNEYDYAILMANWTTHGS